MIKNKVYKLKEATEVAKGMPLNAGQEIEVVMGVVFINGNMCPPSMQKLFMEWLENNPILFDDDTRQW